MAPLAGGPAEGAGGMSWRDRHLPSVIQTASCGHSGTRAVAGGQLQRTGSSDGQLPVQEGKLWASRPGPSVGAEEVTPAPVPGDGAGGDSALRAWGSPREA